MPLEIQRYRDETKILTDEIKKLIHEYVEKETGRRVHSVELHSSGSIGAATIRFKFADE